jgi:D-lyxose ketol-isomerase
MKRSVINNHIREAKEFIAGMRFALPPFAYWSPDEWKTKGPEYDEIRDNQLGWDLTDFGRGDYEKLGLFLFTIRNGSIHKPSGKTYAEKLLIVKPGQITPFHYHRSKMEDIINRGGGGALKIKLYRSLDERTLDEKTDVPVSVDGRNYTVKAGTEVSLKTGESITLKQGVFHQFWSDDAMLLLGEVSMVNDDHADNFFLEEQGRFPYIEEDEEPLHLLVGDYFR